MGTTVACGLCSHFRPGIGSSSALGMCRSREPRDRHRGQWPFKNHPCRSFEAAGWSFCYKCCMQLPPARQKTL